jgi:hypothetical protein
MELRNVKLPKMIGTKFWTFKQPSRLLFKTSIGVPSGAQARRCVITACSGWRMNLKSFLYTDDLRRDNMVADFAFLEFRFLKHGSAESRPRPAGRHAPEGARRRDRGTKRLVSPSTRCAGAIPGRRNTPILRHSNPTFRGRGRARARFLCERHPSALFVDWRTRTTVIGFRA